MFFTNKTTKPADQKVYVQGKFKGEFWSKSTVEIGEVSKKQLSDIIINSGHISDASEITATNHLVENTPYRDVLGFFNTVSINNSNHLPHQNYSSIFVRDVRLKNAVITTLSSAGGKYQGSIEADISGYIFNYDLDYQAQQNYFNHPTAEKKPTVSQTKKNWPKEKPATASLKNKIEKVFLWGLISLVMIFGISTQTWIFVLISLVFAARNLFPTLRKKVKSNLLFVAKKVLPKIAAVVVLVGMVSLWGYFRTHRSTQDNSNLFNENEISGVIYDTLLKDSVIVHHRIWENYQKQKFEGDIKILKKDYNHTRRTRRITLQPAYNNTFWSKVYSELIAIDSVKLKNLIKDFSHLKTDRKLSDKTLIETVGCFIQDIKYALVLQEKCNPKTHQDDENFKRVYKNCKSCCVGNVKYGVHSPVEFLTTLKGDCDTRTVLAHLILKKLGYDAVILNSNLYRHSMLGIALPNQLGSFKRIQGKKYYFWELTAKNYQPGYLPKDNSNINAWELELK